ncbi:hypothetical protein T484DRAFT_1853016 [Baffinella frigidus]|nr:hypothetical protein T484DRAFT_1853016 [Cryptophyta sp. CCMP2293]
MYVNNARWAGVPFVLVAGKALDEKLVDIRVQFKPISALDEKLVDIRVQFKPISGVCVEGKYVLR